MDVLEADLIAAVLAAPDDDAPRLVYADWLLERGDPRGELIGIQCALGRSLWGAKGQVMRNDANAKEPPTKEELEKREKALLKKHQKDWVAPIRPYIRTWTWRRGFIDRVEADGLKFMNGAATIFANTPLFHAELTGFKPRDLQTFATIEPISALRSLSLARQRIDASRASVFLAPNLRGLRELDIWGNPLGDAGVTTLASSPHLGALRVLNLAHCETLATGLEALSKATFFPRLETLVLDVGYDADGTKAIGPRAGELLARGESLVSLSVTGVKLGDEGVAALAASPALANLETLSVFGNDITPAGALALARSSQLPRLKKVHGLTPYGVDLPPEVETALVERFGDAWS